MELSSPPSCLVVEDHDAVRAALRLFLERAGIEVVGEAASGDEAVELLATIRADVAVLDYRLPDMTAFDIAEQARHVAPGVALVLHTGELTVAVARDAFAAGIHGVVMKAVPPARLVAAIRAALRGERYLDPTTPELATAQS